MESKAEGAEVRRKRDWPSISGRLAIGILVGATITSIPWLVSELDYEALWPINFLLLPGTFVGIVLSGNVHLISQFVLYTSNVIAYALLTYWLQSARKRSRP